MSHNFTPLIIDLIGSPSGLPTLALARRTTVWRHSQAVGRDEDGAGWLLARGD